MPRKDDETPAAVLNLATNNPTLVQSILAPIVMVLGVITIGVFLTMSIRGRVARRNSRTPPPHEMIEQIKERATSRAATTTATSEMLETTRRLAAQLDNKAARLEQLIADADARLALLDGQQATTSAATASSNGPAIRDSPGEDEPDPLTRAVYDLADAGNEPVDIARQLDEQIGKVELILALRR